MLQNLAERLGAAGDDRFHTHWSFSSPASAGRWRRPAAADSSRERGSQPSLAGVLARRQGSPLCCRSTANIWTNAQVAAQSLATGERRNLISRGIATPLCAFRASALCARGNPDGRAVRSPAIGGHWRGDPRGRGRSAILRQRSRPIQHFRNGIAGLCCGGRSVGPEQVGVGQSKWSRTAVGCPARAYLHHGFPLTAGGSPWPSRNRRRKFGIYDLSRETLTRFTFEGNRNLAPAWTPDGKRIAFISNKEGPPNIFWQLADGSGGLERLTTSQYTHVPDVMVARTGNCSPSWKSIPPRDMTSGCCGSSDRKAQPFLRTPSNETVPRFSPDGRWLAYISDESGRYEVYVQPYPARAESGKFRPKAAPSRCGIRTGANCSTAAATR